MPFGYHLIIYNFLSGIIITSATTGLLPAALPFKSRAVLTLYITVMAIIGNLYLGNILGILMVTGLLLLIMYMAKEDKIQNVFFACLGYGICISGNSFVLFLLDALFGLSTNDIIQKYWFPFSLGYFCALNALFIPLRKLIYTYWQLPQLLRHIKKPMLYTLAGNLFLYIIIFIVNISLGEHIGYTKEALAFNSLLFFICLVSSSILIFTCMKSFINTQQHEMILRQQTILEGYVASLEGTVDEMRSFRHDYKNILSTMAAYLHEEKFKELEEYFYRKINLPIANSELQMEAWKHLKNIQPMELKGFLYEKLLLLFTRSLKFQIRISDNLKVTYTPTEPLIRILGIFIDNAIESAECTPDGEVILEITATEKGVSFYISNTFSSPPDLFSMGKKGYSTKGNDRGNGLYWAEKAIHENEQFFHILEIQGNRLIQQLEVIKK